MTRPAPADFFKRVDEIDVLRAIAVLAVVANHAFGVRGGFLGVDVFFVISGYVITLLLLKDVTLDRFSLSTFYHHRIARIIPPLFVVTLFIYGFAKLLFWLPEDYEFIQQSYGYQAFFAQNFYFAEQAANYFQGLDSAKLNLHLWSLAVEEQFYIIYPFLFLLAFKYRNASWIGYAIGGFFAFSLLLMSPLFESLVAPTLASMLGMDKNASLEGLRYYLLPTRAWQLLAGALACIGAYKLVTSPRELPNKLTETHIKLIAAIAMIALLLALGFTHQTMMWPNGATFIPVIATVVLLVALHLYRGVALPAITNRTSLLAIGRSSYSLYLWHWPILGVMVYTGNDKGNVVLISLSYLLLTGIFTALTYHFVEKKRHHINQLHSGIILALFVGFSLFVANVGPSTREVPAQVKQILESATYSATCKTCITNPDKDFVILWGDSHAVMFMDTMEKTAKESNLELVYIRRSLRNADNNELQELIKSPHFKGVFLASRWSMYGIGFPKDEPEERGDRFIQIDGKKPRTKAQALNNYLQRLDELLVILDGKPVYIVKEVPRYSFFPKKEAIMEWLGLQFIEPPEKRLEIHREEQQPISKIFDDMASKYQNVRLIDPAKTLCSSDICTWREGWNILYKDDDHLSIYGAKKIAPEFSKAIEEMQDRQAQ